MSDDEYVESIENDGEEDDMIVEETRGVFDGNVFDLFDNFSDI